MHSPIFLECAVDFVKSKGLSLYIKELHNLYSSRSVITVLQMYAVFG
jgi:hypothetical protein